MQLCRIRSGKVQSCDACIVKELLQAKKKPKIAIPVVRRGPKRFVCLSLGSVGRFYSTSHTQSELALLEHWVVNS